MELFLPSTRSTICLHSFLLFLFLFPSSILCGPYSYATTYSLAQKVSGRMKSELEYDPPTHYELEAYLMSHYNNRLIPKRSSLRAPMKIYFTIGLYQIIEVNEPEEAVLLNCWIVERWEDDFLYWDPSEFNNLTTIVIPRELIWLPDTTLYNSVIMDDKKSRRIQNVKVTTLLEKKTALVEMLYPTLHKFSCVLDLRFFPFDFQNCAMTFGSWIHDNKAIDYFANAYPPSVTNSTDPMSLGVEYCIENEGWNILSTDVVRREVKFKCCANNYTLLEFYLKIQRKPLFYFVNLIIPSLMISLISIVGFFSSPTVNDIRDEKINMGITTLLSMSILIFMVADKMPSTSSFIPLIGWFYTSMVMLISFGTLAGSLVIFVQKRGIMGDRPSSKTMRWAKRVATIIRMDMPLLMKQAYQQKANEEKLAKQRKMAENALQKRMLRRFRKKSVVQLWSKINAVEQPRSNVYYPTLSMGLASVTPTTASALRRGSNPKYEEPKQKEESPERKESNNEPNDNEELSPRRSESNASLDQLVDLLEGGTGANCYRPLPQNSRCGSVSDMYACIINETGNTDTAKRVQRNLAQIEYDWLAAVIEKVFLIVFCTMFFLMSFGINGLGLVHWFSLIDDVPNR